MAFLIYACLIDNGDGKGEGEGEDESAWDRTHRIDNADDIG